ncbi:hypothetical protein BDZ97DRAFT_161169 [Flammula alnicola]|nr:hypothetical protein BDZ97DRAFT_161169 [Flammula alnicola]
MEAINTTFQHLENISTTTRKGKKDVEEAVTHLSSIARLLELPSASGNTFARLSEILRGRLLPLYRASLSLALDYAVAVFSFIHNNKLTPLSKSGNPQHSWENLLISLLSGILDFLDENSNNKNRESVAFALYPALCSFYFLQPAGPSLIFSGELLSVVYQVLIATADCHAQNAGKLRDYDVGSARLGLTISQTKDFLALESLLDLLGSLIPPLKGGRDKRTQFIKEVFDPSIFKYTSDPILGYLESISSPDWSVTSEKIIKVLAEYDISFPQPFEASSLVLNGLPIDSSSPVYVDKLQFIANLDKDGKIETLHIPFSTVLHILIFASADQEILVVVKILKPPMLGNEPISVSSDEEISVSWKIKKSHMNNFGRALKSRNLTIGHPASRKLSKVKAIELDFDSSKQDSLILTQERLQKVSQAWATSPKRADNITSAAHEPILPSWDTAPSTIFLGPDGTFGLSPNSMQSNLPGKTNTNVLNDSKDSDHALPPDTHHPSNYENGGQIGTDERQFHPRSRPTTRSKKRIVEVSDDDEVEALLDKSPIRASTIDALPASRLKSDSLLPMTQMTQKGRPSTRSTKALPAKARTEVKPKPKQGIDHNRLEKPIPDLDGPQQMKKRPVQEIEAKDTELYTDEGRPAKRIRSEAPSHSPVPPVPMRSYQRKKYGRKGLQSSPVALVSPSIYFDEVPKPKPQNKLETKVPNVSTKPRASAMKGKNGNSVPKRNLHPQKSKM